MEYCSSSEAGDLSKQFSESCDFGILVRLKLSGFDTFVACWLRKRNNCAGYGGRHGLVQLLNDY